MIYILYSSDYELFLGGNYRPEHDVLIDPTERLLQTCEDLGIPITLFADIACLWRYRELGRPAFPELVEAQLRDAVKRGHDVQTHLHPHWLATEIVDGDNGSTRYEFDLAKYLLGGWHPGGGLELTEFAARLLRRAKTHLEALLHPVDSSYRCIASRAGGYGIQPGMREIIGALLSEGYLIDSSVVPGMVQRSNVNRIDFSDAPAEGRYRVSPETGYTTADGEGIFEIPVAALREGEATDLMFRATMLRVANRLLRRHSAPPPGCAIQDTDEAVVNWSMLDRIKAHAGVIRRGWMMLELRPESAVMAEAALRYIDRYASDDEDLYFSVSCHPKSIDARLLEALRKFHRHLKSACRERLVASTFQGAAQRLALD